jgi:predicted nucleic acid-binding protein
LAVSQAVAALVVDCSVVVKWELPAEEYTSEAMELFQDWQAGAVVVHSPDLLPSEIGSVFLRALRRDRVTDEEARASIQNLLSLDYILHDSRPLVPSAFEIAHRHNQRIYDCFYVALAERDGISFWTSDERLYNALHLDYPFVQFIAHYTPHRPLPAF